MTQAMRVLSINGSYRDNGITDQAIEAATLALRESGAEVEAITLRDYPIEFCLNCRVCCQQPGEAPGCCVHNDGMRELVEKIEHADAYIIAAPTNFGSVTAVFKRFMERLIVYAYWPWGAPGPKDRKVKTARKKAMLISSCAAPGLMGRMLYQTQKQLKMTAKIIGADPVGTLFTGLISRGARHSPAEADATQGPGSREQALVTATIRHRENGSAGRGVTLSWRERHDCNPVPDHARRIFLRCRKQTDASAGLGDDPARDRFSSKQVDWLRDPSATTFED